MGRPLALTLGILMAALSGWMGCADIVGADFDNVHPRTQGTDGSAGAESRVSDGGVVEDGLGEDTSQRQPGNADATSEGRRDPGDAAFGDHAGGWPDVTDTDHGFDADNVIDAGHPSDGGDAIDDVRSSDQRGAIDDVRSSDQRDAIDDVRSSDDGNATDAGDVVDAGSEPPPDGPRITVVIGGFVSTGIPNRATPTIELRGHIISNAAISGRTSTGISIEGRFQ